MPCTGDLWVPYPKAKVSIPRNQPSQNRDHLTITGIQTRSAKRSGIIRCGRLSIFPGCLVFVATPSRRGCDPTPHTTSMCQYLFG